ncbi:MAG: metalloregulator ArsR/SmtB family transcription factor [Eubacterium sp.]|nr:metalloregulator ArsR/SmtB family transcription factor [Eubacterium sp.]
MTVGKNKAEDIELCEEHCVHPHIALKELPSEEETTAVAGLFKTFGDPTRLRILAALSMQEMCVCDIADLLEMTQSAISHQLSVLKAKALVKARRDGKTVFYSLADGHVSTILAQGLEHVNE